METGNTSEGQQFFITNKYYKSYIKRKSNAIEYNTKTLFSRVFVFNVSYISNPEQHLTYIYLTSWTRNFWKSRPGPFTWQFGQCTSFETWKLLMHGSWTMRPLHLYLIHTILAQDFNKKDLFSFSSFEIPTAIESPGARESGGSSPLWPPSLSDISLRSLGPS